MKRRRRNHGQFRPAGIADPAPILTDADAVTRAAKVLAAARETPERRAERSAQIAAHIAALQADIARRLAARALNQSEPPHHPV